MSIGMNKGSSNLLLINQNHIRKNANMGVFRAISGLFLGPQGPLYLKINSLGIGKIFFTSYLFSLQVVIGFTYVFAQIVLFGIFQQISTNFYEEIVQY